MCEPVSIISGIAGIASSVGGFQQQQQQVNMANAASRRNYEYALAKRKAEWESTLSIWGSKNIDYKNQTSENFSAADRAAATEQAKLNEMYMQTAFQGQDMMTELLQSRGSIMAGAQSGNTKARMDLAAMSQFGRNHAIIAENLASARGGMMRANDQNRLQLQSANNQAWSQIANAPIPDMAPQTPEMMSGPSPLGLIAGIASAGAGMVGGALKAKPNSFNDTGNAGTQNFTGTGGSGFNWGDATKYQPSFPTSGGNNFTGTGGNGFSNPWSYQR